LADSKKTKNDALMEKNSVLHTKNLSIGYTTKKGKNVVCNNISIHLQKGKLIALIGENGIGKSTLIKTITNNHKALSGEVLLKNQDINLFTENNLAKEISVVLTEKIPMSNLTAYELISLGRIPYSNWLGNLSEQDKSAIKHAVEICEIEKLIHKKLYELSDGQLQKVMISRALAQDTDIIILDEPTTHLDLFHKVRVLKLLTKMAHENNKCILFSTHDIDLAIQLCDEIILIKKDQIIQDEPCKLIEKGVFDTLFNDESIRFDKEKGQFKVK
jgi:iron complex transport system ATP-binding protein